MDAAVRPRDGYHVAATEREIDSPRAVDAELIMMLRAHDHPYWRGSLIRGIHSLIAVLIGTPL